MKINDYLIELHGFNWQSMLEEWSFLVQGDYSVWVANRFGDVFLVAPDQSIWMLDIGAGTVEQLAPTKDVFCELIDQDSNANLWLMIPLVDELVAAGKTLSAGQCYSYIKPPILGGSYSAENTMLVPATEHYSLYASIHRQLKDAPDGTQVKLKIVE